MKISTAVALLAVALVARCAGAPGREARKLEDLYAERRAQDGARSAGAKRLVAQMLARAEAKARTPGATIDLLIISGGGDWGAFGAGVLKGWGRVAGEMARPQFDAVTGVSTGALIAPFAFLGDDASIERIVQLYRNPATDIATSRGLLFFLPSNPSFYLLPGLERELHTALDRPMLERIAAQAASRNGCTASCWRAPASRRSSRRKRSALICSSTAPSPATSCTARASTRSRGWPRSGAPSTARRRRRACATG